MKYLILLLFLPFAACDSSEQKYTISGEAQGTTYSVTYIGKQQKDLKQEIDALLLAFDFSLSTYNPGSLITQLNNNSTDSTDEYFRVVFNKSLEFSELTNGAFDVTISPILNVWGFGHTPQAKKDSAEIANLLKLVGYEKVRLIGGKLFKSNASITLNFNAIAQGYSVDVVSDYLVSKGINNFLVEIGGEIRAKGKKGNEELWRVGIDKPSDDLEDRPLQAVINLEDLSLATSGNYRKFFVEDGNRYGHTIDPRTGYPAKNNLLSVTVIAEDCMTADAMATAFMVMGLEQTLMFLENHPELNLDLFLIYDEQGEMKTFISKGLQNRITEIS
jgi:FAD:protein FMN transferase